MSIVLRVMTVAGALALLPACEPTEEEPEAAERAEPAAEQPVGQPPAGTPAPGAMPGMQGGAATQQQMQQQMRAHMRSMHGASPDSMHAMLPAHRQMATNMLSQMDQEMRQMNAADAAWTATVDSVRQDLNRMPAMSPEELDAFMPEHERRVTRLMDLHQRAVSGSGT